MSYTPDDNAIRTWTSSHALHRGRDYLGQVKMPKRRDAVITAMVPGRRAAPYQVEVELGEDRVLDAMCTCPIGGAGRCKHVAAVLLTWSQSPERFATEEAAPVSGPALDPPMSGRVLRAWATDHGVVDVLERPVRAVVRGYHPWVWGRRSGLGPTVADALTDRRAPAEVAREVAETVQRIANRVSLALKFEAERATSRDRAADPLLSGLHDALLGRRRTLRGRGVLPVVAGPDSTPRVSIKVDPPTAVCVVDGVGFTWRLDGTDAEAVTGPDEAHLTAIDAVLDRVVSDGAALAAEALEALRTPMWAHGLADLDAVLARVAATEALPDEEGRLFGWRVATNASGMTIEPVLLRPYKNREGLRTWNASFHDAALAADQRAAAILSERAFGLAHSHDAVRRRTLRAIEVLVGHPRVVIKVGNRHTELRVTRSALALGWRDHEAGGVHIVPRLNDQPVPVEAADALLTTHVSGAALWLDRKARVLHLVAIDEACARLVAVLQRRGWHWPAEARGDLLQRLEAFQAVVPVALEGDLRGEEVEADPRPLVRLEPMLDGSLKVDLYARPLADGPLLPLGTGPVEASAVRDGHRVVATRDLADERQRAAEALADWRPSPDATSWYVDDVEQALGLIASLRDRTDALQIEWARPAPRLTRQAASSDLRVRGTRRRDWFDLEGQLDVDGVTVPLADVLAAIRTRRRFVRVDDQTWLRLSDALRAQLEATASVAWEQRGRLRTSTLGAATLAEVEDAGARVELPEAFRADLARLREAPSLDPVVPDSLQAELRDYQREGFVWLARLAHWATGAVLADDMGLGKTIQALTLLLHRVDEGPVLVVAPASVGVNWQREAERFAPSLSVHPYRGGGRTELLTEVGPGAVLVTSWELMARDIEDLAAVRFGTVVLDEAQAIKNPGTQRARAAARLDAGFVLALTGTPVENRVGELWSLFRVVAPGLLGSAQRFRERFASPIERDGDDGVRGTLSRLVRPFLLRRRKSEVATQLPPRTDAVLHVDLSADERRRYEQVRAAAAAAMAGDEGERFQILAALTRLRQLACHPRLVDPQAPPRSSKLDALLELVADLRDNDHRALVFSQFTAHLALVHDALAAAGYNVRTLDGSMSVRARQREVDAFQDGDGDVFLISLKAGGTGLNLTAASYVIHLDPWWNPAVEDQASDRAHRIGQTRPVTVYRLVARDTIEEVVLQLHADKRALVSDLLEGTATPTLSTAALLELLA